ncbi:hypothetical protein HWC26_gp034 [Aeromonas phage 2L372X]|uniref:Uncharacterized protein n=2 Tax=Plateaulakevirus TaxID=2843436 RepID=A0A5B9N6R3_9CAUD|nr:hypothetical protein HWC25_gp038 [Aeromonas phage 2L372D]YP_009846371.1 hypothetical protein HWC26_gp034 [Aeromonas phage 2L372X]QDB73952.1 hypothetical protein 2L372D_038 [Aeromonas phage 2L372D]QEG08286.1 hypothetical protein [Aeromonas phage 2L372X]
MTKLYKFEQILDGYTEPYFYMTGTLEEIMYKWFHSPTYMSVGVYLDNLKDTYTVERSKIKSTIEKQKTYIEIVDKNVYGIGWTTKIEEI